MLLDHLERRGFEARGLDAELRDIYEAGVSHDVQILKGTELWERLAALPGAGFTKGRRPIWLPWTHPH